MKIKLIFKLTHYLINAIGILLILSSIYYFIGQPIKDLYDLNQIEKVQIEESKLLKNEFQKKASLIVLERDLEIEIGVNKPNKIGEITIGKESLIYLGKVKIQAFIDLREIEIFRNTEYIEIKLASINWSQPQLNIEESKVITHEIKGINNNKNDLVTEAQALVIEKANELTCSSELEKQAIQQSEVILKELITKVISENINYRIIYPINNCE